MDKKLLTRDEIWFDSGKISERAYILANLENELVEAKKVGIFYTEGLLRAIEIVKGENK
jgi:hypothetical protein